MSLTNPYCTLAQLKEELKISSSDTSKDTALENAINRASRWVEWYTNKVWHKLDYSSTALTIRVPNKAGFRVEGSRIYCPGPFYSVTSVKEGSDTLVANQDYYLDYDDTVIVRVDDGVETEWDFIPPEVVIELKGKFGYDTTDGSTPAATLPSNVSYATVLTAASFSGENRKQMQRADGTTEEVVLKKIPDVVFQMLGKSGVMGAGQVTF